MIKVISFDIGGTILKINNINGYSFKELSLIVNKPYEEVKKSYKNIFQKQTGTLEELIDRFCSELNIEINDDIYNFFKEKFSIENNKSIIEEDIKKVIKNLKSKGYKIILCSNSCCLIKNSFSESFLENIDNIFYSYEVGYTKDYAEFYSIIEEKMKYKKEEFLHVGDTLDSDYFYPKKYGWNALYYGKIDDKEINTITNLNEIEGKIEYANRKRS